MASLESVMPRRFCSVMTKWTRFQMLGNWVLPNCRGITADAIPAKENQREIFPVGSLLRGMPLWSLSRIQQKQNKFSGWRTAILLRSAFQIRIPGSRCCSRTNRPTHTISILSIIGCGWKFGRRLKQSRTQHSQ